MAPCPKVGCLTVIEPELSGHLDESHQDDLTPACGDRFRTIETVFTPLAQHDVAGFAGIGRWLRSLRMSVFLDLEPSAWVASNELAFAVCDGFGRNALLGIVNADHTLAGFQSTFKNGIPLPPPLLAISAAS